jgi:hypothetical protein
MVQGEIGTGSNDQNKIDQFFNDWKVGIWNDVSENAPENPDYVPTDGPIAIQPAQPKFLVTVGASEVPQEYNSLRDQAGFEVNTSVGLTKQEIFQSF